MVTPVRGRLQSGVREFRIEIDSRSLLSRANCARQRSRKTSKRKEEGKGSERREERIRRG